MSLDAVVPGTAMDRLRVALAAADRFGWSHGEDCPRASCEDEGCEAGDVCSTGEHVCRCGVAEVEDLIAAVKAVCL